MTSRNQMKRKKSQPEATTMTGPNPLEAESWQRAAEEPPPQTYPQVKFRMEIKILHRYAESNHQRGYHPR
ncbi:hypothetical protein KDH_12590 [Dictyobacter sp. S3.2.2.5]|uniref:Uncharacterized protein n=1 Tax=Dictyobacter halimunensis TaxID=3026934 RepID=A0ABQ6FMC0_9CHLR|nr:hypothetical protein KDH_12590 [Dictyobacter sp. S3.2.2.5]